jgi:hypothetical protein
LPESATECTLSASIDPERVIRKPTNLATAMPALASRAATTALVPCAPPAMRSNVAVEHDSPVTLLELAAVAAGVIDLSTRVCPVRRLIDDGDRRRDQEV